MLALVPMTVGEFSAFFEAVARSHADDNIAAGRWDASVALTLAREETRRLLPESEKTPENFLFVLQHTDIESDIGYLWFGNTNRASKRVAYLYQLFIHPRFRSQGYGRQALHAFEKEARNRGYDALALHVFATNEVAHRLYQAEGYSASSITMRKELRPSAA